MYRILLLVLAAASLLTGCTDPFTPDVIKSPPSYLVVDGFLNAQGVTTIKLSRTFAIDAKTAPPVESRALAFIEDDAGGRLPLPESAVKGTYVSAAQALNPARKYRLHLTTTAGQEYASDYVPVKLTPAVDNVKPKVENGTLTLAVNAHDNANNTHYYRWEYTETWEIRPDYNSNLEYVNHVMLQRPVPVYPGACWGNELSKAVLIDKTTAQSQDVVADFPLKKLPANTERLSSRYSILVQQHALTKEEYAYWELLRKNTESIGSLYDPQPAQLTGNVHCLSNVSTLALGFVSAHSVAEKRIFLTRADLPSGAGTLTGYEKCTPLVYIDLYPVGVPDSPQEIMDGTFGIRTYVPVGVMLKPGSSMVIGYYGAVPDCLDCRLRGTSTKPSFWP